MEADCQEDNVAILQTAAEVPGPCRPPPRYRSSVAPPRVPRGNAVLSAVTPPFPQSRETPPFPAVTPPFPSTKNTFHFGRAHVQSDLDWTYPAPWLYPSDASDVQSGLTV